MEKENAGNAGVFFVVCQSGHHLPKVPALTITICLGSM